MKVFPPRKNDTHKSDYGHVFILAGSWIYSGAAVLAAAGAVRMGAGVVTLGVPAEIYAVVCSRVRPEIIVRSFASESGVFSKKSADEISRFIGDVKIDSVVFGPGLTKTDSVKNILNEVILNLDCPTVIDADGINVLSESSVVVKKSCKNLILTPHPKEASRLLNLTIDVIEKNRKFAAKSISERYNAVCVLKGFRTIVADDKRIYINKTGNPGMATAGSGDVLSGMMGAVINQISPLYEAAKTTVYLHGLSGDVSKRVMGEVSMIASDIVENIPAAIKKFQR